VNAYFDRGFNQEINFRFQTIGELSGRLSEILAPPSDKEPEPLSIVVSKSREMLLRRDKKTIVTEFRSAIESKVDALEKRVLQNVGDTRPHYVYAMDSSMRSSLNQGFEHLFTYRFRVGNNVHDTTFFVDYSFHLSGMECVVTRRILEKIGEILTNTNSSLHNVKVVTGEKVVCRYCNPVDMPVEIIASDALSAFGKAIELLTSKILNANSNDALTSERPGGERAVKKQQTTRRQKANPITEKQTPTNRKAVNIDWTRLIDNMVLSTSGNAGGSTTFLQMAKRRGLKPFLDSPRGANWGSVTCAGATLTERMMSSRLGQPEDETKRQYEITISPDLISEVGPLVDRWYRGLKNYEPLAVRVRFIYAVEIEREAHRIKTNIFKSELEMSGRDEFSFRKQWFTLDKNRNLDMRIWKKFDEIPWAALITALVDTEVLLVEKKLLAKIRANC
jgi:hypothetical protein